MGNLLINLVTLLCVLGLFAETGSAQTDYNNNTALKGVDKAKVYFDINLKDDNLLVFRMEMLDRTVRQLAEAGVQVSVVIGFRGGASRFITKDDHYVLYEETANKMKVQQWVSDFAGRGFTVEQCSIAADMLDIDYQDFLPEVTVVGNGYVSLVGYQARGYAVVPMD